MRTPNGPRGFKGGKVVKKLTAIILMIVGLLLSLPFVYGMIFSAPSVLMTLWDMMCIILLVIGGPTFMYGTASFFSRTYGSASTTDIELGRIRYAVEQDRWERK